MDREAKGRPGRYSGQELHRAAELLAALEAVGEEHGVPASVWPAVTSLPAAVLDAVAAGRVRTAGREWPA